MDEFLIHKKPKSENDFGSLVRIVELYSKLPI